MRINCVCVFFFLCLSCGLGCFSIDRIEFYNSAAVPTLGNDSLYVEVYDTYNKQQQQNSQPKPPESADGGGGGFANPAWSSDDFDLFMGGSGATSTNNNRSATLTTTTTTTSTNSTSTTNSTPLDMGYLMPISSTTDMMARSSLVELEQSSSSVGFRTRVLQARA
jgi:hypothetical protein